MKNLNFEMSNHYFKKICPYIFLNTYVNRLTFNDISNSLIMKNQLEFLDVDDDDLSNSNLIFLSVVLVYENVTSRLINPQVFKYMEILYITGVLNDIQMDLFSFFDKIKLISINLYNLKELIHSNYKWMSYINSKVAVTLSDPFNVRENIGYAVLFQIIQKQNNFKENPFMVTTFNKAYTYPDEDFCIFKEFPHDHLVYPIIISSIRLECTCSIIWLIQYSKFYLKEDLSDYKISNYHFEYKEIYVDDYINHTVKFCIGDNLNKRIADCKFKEKLKLCNTTEFKTEAVSKFALNNDYDVLYFIKWLELVILVFLQPLFCLIGIITNSLTISTIKNKTFSSKMTDNMYKHIFMNSIFNLLFCILTILKIINICVLESSFCSSIYKDVSSQYFKIIGEFFLGNVFKLCANFSYISFAFSRYCLSASKKNGFYKRFDKLNLKFYYLFIILFSVLLSVFIFFEYNINKEYNLYKSYPYKYYDIDVCFYSDAKLYCNLFKTLNLINDFIKNILFYILNTIIDLLLFLHARTVLNNKKNLFKEKSKLENAIKTKEKINKMVVANGIIFSIAYFPELIINLLLLYYGKIIYPFCFQYMLG
jgi:hypothetical protein